METRVSVAAGVVVKPLEMMMELVKGGMWVLKPVRIV